MPLDFIPIDQNPWVKVLDQVRLQIADEDLSFHKFCVATFAKAPRVFARYGTGDNAAYWDVPLTDCPSVLLTSINTPFVPDQGAGYEEWRLAFSITVKFELRDRDQRKAIAGNYELLRTINHKFRGPGTLNRIRSSGGVKNMEFRGDMTPEIALAGSQTTAKTTFVVLIGMIEAFRG